MKVNLTNANVDALQKLKKGLTSDLKGQTGDTRKYLKNLRDNVANILDKHEVRKGKDY